MAETNARQKKEQVHVSEGKKKIVQSLTDLIDSKNTIMLVSIKGLPAAQFQKIKRKLVKEAEIKVPKKRMLKMAIEGSKKQGIKKLDDYLKEDIAVLISDTDAFELAEKLDKEKSPVKVKAGQEAIEDVEIGAGITDLPAGPIVSELGSLGLAVKISGGKIEILQPKVIVEKGKSISETAAGIMGKLDIMPFSVGYVPLIAYDSKSGKVYETLVLDKKQLIKDMKSMFAKSKSFAVSLGYISKDTIGMLLAKAESHEKAMSKFLKPESTSQEEPKLNQGNE